MYGAERRGAPMFSCVRAGDAPIRERGLKIPDEISVIGFDDMPWASLLQPPLTAVAQPTYELGQRAAELLLGRLKERNKPAVLEHLPTQLIVRGSTGKPRPE